MHKEDVGYADTNNDVDDAERLWYFVDNLQQQTSCVSKTHSDDAVNKFLT